MRSTNLVDQSLHEKLTCLFFSSAELNYSHCLFRSQPFCVDQGKFTMAHEALLFSDSFDHMLFCCLGILVSAYALYVETRKHKDSKYKAACDLGENMSCSRVLTSRSVKSLNTIARPVEICLMLIIVKAL